MFISYIEWYALEYQQKQIVKLEVAFDLLDKTNVMSANFNKEEFIDEIMRATYDEEISEVL